MATKVTIVNGEQRPAPKRQGPNPASKSIGKVVDLWKEFTGFLGDVRAETRKVVTPSRKEVQATTTVVVITVFLFALYFAVIDFVIQHGVTALFDYFKLH